MKTTFDTITIRRFIDQFKLQDSFSEIDAIPFQLRSYEPNEIILREGGELDGIYLQVEGQTKVSSSVETGKSLLLRFCHPLSIFGDIELVQKVVVQSEVLALRKTSLLFIDRRTVETKLMQDNRFVNELLKHLAYKLQTCTSASRINLLSSVEERLAIYLMTTHNANEFGKEIQTENVTEIASVIGTTPRHLNRTIQRLSNAGILSKKRNGFLVMNWEKIDEISGGLRFY